MKLIAKIIILIAVFIIGFLSGQKSPNLLNKAVEMDNQKIEQGEAIASLMIDFGDGEIKTFNGIKIEEGTSVFDFSKKVCEENNLEFKYKDFGGELGAMIEKIGEKENNFDGGFYWQYWVNNSYAKIGAGSMKINKGDIVEWKFIKGQVE